VYAGLGYDEDDAFWLGTLDEMYVLWQGLARHVVKQGVSYAWAVGAFGMTSVKAVEMSIACCC
jgi:hypothetical protein